ATGLVCLRFDSAPQLPSQTFAPPLFRHIERHHISHAATLNTLHVNNAKTRQTIFFRNHHAGLLRLGEPPHRRPGKPERGFEARFVQREQSCEIIAAVGAKYHLDLLPGVTGLASCRKQLVSPQLVQLRTATVMASASTSTLTRIACRARNLKST